MNIDRDFISRVILDNDVVEAVEHKIHPDWFPEDSDEREAWRYILDFYAEHRETPTKRVLKRHLPTFVLSDPQEPLTFYIEELVRARKIELLLEGIEDAALHLTGDHRADPDAAIDALARSVAQAHTETSILRDVDLVTSWERRIEHYEEIRKRGGSLIGIPTGFRAIDEALSGLQPQQFVVLIGLPKAGKSSMLLKMAIEAHRVGKVPLFVGFEMSNAEQEARYDAMLAHLNHQSLVRGDTTVAERAALEKALKKRSSMQPFILSADIASATTVSGIAAKVDQYQPDVVFVDGLYLMEDEQRGDDERKQLTNISRGMKRMAQRLKIPVVGTTQALRGKSRGGLTAGSAGYTSAYEQDADVMFGVESDKDDEDIKRFSVLTARNAKYTEAVLRWDWERGTVEELFGPEAEESPTTIDDVI